VGDTPGLHSATATSGDLDSILAIAAGTKVTPSTLRSLQTSIEDYWRRDDEHGGEALRPAVIGQLRYVKGILADSTDPNYRRSLHGIAAELARLTGWTFFDARQYSTARTYFTESLCLARAIDDRAFVANVLACLSLQATYQDRAEEAVTLARTAQDITRYDGGTPRLMAMLSIREAFGHASAHDQQADSRPSTRRSATSAASTPQTTTRPGSATSTRPNSPWTSASPSDSSAMRRPPSH
jgi:hypothetical protein